LHEAGAGLTITGRNSARAQALAKVVGAGVVTLPAAEKQKYDVLLNATPVGMHPDTNRCLFKDNIPGELVFDMVYNPRETLLLQRARAQGRKVVYGCEMFLEQAAEQFEIWTGETAPRAVMRQSLEG
jgi:shikimate 5-dehydrogenase